MPPRRDGELQGPRAGALGDLGSFSFHETKNITSGEGGSLLVNDPDLVLRAEIIRKKERIGADFFEAKSTIHLAGCRIVFLPSEITAAFLLAQLEEAQRITAERLAAWQRYHEMLAPLEQQGLFRRPIVPPGCQHNGHIYYIILAPEIDRQAVLDELKRNEIGAVFHYVPLHSSPAGMRFGRAHGDLSLTASLSQRLIRLPMWVGLSQTQQQRVVDVLRIFLRR